MQIRHFEKLPVWKRSMDLVVAVYRFTKLLPADEKPLLAGTMRRTVASVPVKIAAGADESDPVALGKAMDDVVTLMREMRTHLLIAERLRYVGRFRTRPLLRRISRIARLARELSASMDTAKDERVNPPEPTDAPPPPLPLRPAA
jgi:four helix bundle protein